MYLQIASRLGRRNRMPPAGGSAQAAPVPAPLPPQPAPSPQPDQANDQPLWRAMAWFVVPQTANALLQIVDALNYPSATCGPTKATALKIYPPNQTEPVYLPNTSTGCNRPAGRGRV